MTDGSPEEVLTRMFRVFDVNSDGEISKKELKKLIKSMNGLIKEEDVDQVNLMICSQDSITLLKATDDMIATTTLAEMDDDSDGKISLDEYIKACMEKEQFTRMLTLKVIDIFIQDENNEETEENPE